MKNTRLAFAFILIHLCIMTFAQSSKKITGRVVDEKGIICKSKFPWFPERSVQFSGKRTKRSVQKKGCTQHL